MKYTCNTDVKSGGSHRRPTSPTPPTVACPVKIQDVSWNNFRLMESPAAPNVDSYDDLSQSNGYSR